MTTSTRGSNDHAQPIRGPGELVQAIPYLIGYHPDESVVLVGLNSGRLVVTVRLDLADLEAEQADAVLDHTIRCATQSRATEFVVLVYTEGPASPPLPEGVVRLTSGGRRPRAGGSLSSSPSGSLSGSLPGAEPAGAAWAALDRHGAVLLDSLLVRSGRYWSYLSVGPADGTAFAVTPSPFVAEATVAGTAPRRDRASVEASLDPCTDRERAALERPLDAARSAGVSAVLNGGRSRHERASRRAVLAAAKACDLPGWTPPADGELARLAVALTSIETRDEVWLAIESGRLDARPLMLDMARRCPSPYDAAPLFLYGWACWRAGNSMLAGVAGRRAAAADPGYTAAQLLIDAVRHGVDPHRVPQLRRPRTLR